MGTARYISQFYGQNSGIKYDFELHDLDYSGAATEVIIDNNGVVIEWTQEDEVFASIRSTQCTVVMQIANTTMESTIMSLMEKADKKLYIVIYKDGEPYWGGPVNMKGMEIEQNSNPPFIKWQGMDWIGGLQNLTWKPSNWDSISEGFVKYTDVLADIFIKAYPSFANTFYMPGTTLFSTASPVTSTQFSGTPDPFNKTGFFTLAYIDDKFNYSYTYHQVLEMLLTDWCAKVIYSDGIYRVIDNRYYQWPTSWVEYFYDKSGVQVGAASSYNNTISYDADNYVWAVDPLLTLDVPIKTVQRTFRSNLSLRTTNNDGYLIYRNTGNSFNQLFKYYSGLLSKGGVLNGWLTGVRSNITIAEGDEIQLTLRLNIKDPDLVKKFAYIYIVIEVTSGATVKRLINNDVDIYGVKPSGQPAEVIWGNSNNNNYFITPYSGSSQYIYTLKFKPPFQNFDLNKVEYGFGGASIAKLGRTYAGGNQIINIDASDLKVGMVVKGSGIPNGTVISSIVKSTTTYGTPYYVVNLSQNVTSAVQSLILIDFYGDDYLFVNGDEAGVEITTELTWLPAGTTNTNEGAKYYCDSSMNSNIVIELPDAKVGDDIGSYNTALRVNNGSSFIGSSGSWKYKPSLVAETARKLIQKLVNNISELRALPLKKYQATLYYRQFYSPHTAIIYNINGQEYTLVFNGGSMVLDADQLDGEWWLIKRTTGVSNGNTTNTGTKIGTKDIYKDVYPYVDFPKLDNDITIAQYESGSAVQSLSLIKGATQQLTELTLDYIASNPQFAFQETGTTPSATNVKEGDICFTNTNGKQWLYTNGAWVQQFQAAAAGSGITTIGTIDSQTKSSNGLVISGSNLVAQTADSTNVGMVSIGTQTFAGAKTFNNGALSSVVITSSNYSAGSGSHISITPNITANANNATINAVSINPTLSASTFTGVTLVDLALTRNNPNINIVSGNLAFMSAQTTQMVIRSASGGVTMLKSKIGSVTGAATNVLDVGGDSLFSAAASTPATASARVHIVGSGTSSGTALLVTNSTPTTIIKADNNQDLYLGSSGGKVGFFAVTPIVRPTTAGAAATYVSGGGGTNIKTDDTFDGYSVQQVVRALKNLGLLT